MLVILNLLNWQKQFLQALLPTCYKNTFSPLKSEEKKTTQEIFHVPFIGANVEDGTWQRRQNRSENRPTARLIRPQKQSSNDRNYAVLYVKTSQILSFGLLTPVMWDRRVARETVMWDNTRVIPFRFYRLKRRTSLKPSGVHCRLVSFGSSKTSEQNGKVSA